ncbi:unnamed protein product [Albugo candida]|uniref:Endonuclease/exonuclease/phosphatase domain-containing protein n=1 Tax=Albugo candida TaxID=65357 RepID=A0A024GV16_9STRA|nr:unnamed protein product [Albugo candida]|eukprot:CCI50575.1 unnamed protein product [Albugo candida]
MQLIIFVENKVDKARSKPVLLTGNFNLDARHNVTHQGRYDIESVLCSESEVYKQLVHNLTTALDHRDVLDQMKNYNTKSKSATCVHPITNGHGRKCIDHMYSCPSKDPTQVANLEIVTSKAQIDFCGIGDTLCLSQAVPITHISDHYGLSAEFRLGESDGSTSIKQLQKSTRLNCIVKSLPCCGN